MLRTPYSPPPTDAVPAPHAIQPSPSTINAAGSASNLLLNMPALPNNKTRRKGVTPIKKPDRDNVWQRTLNAMGLEPMSSNSSSNSNSSTNKATAHEMAAPTSQSEPTQGSKKNLSFLDLPAETQRHIIKQVSAVVMRGNAGIQLGAYQV